MHLVRIYVYLYNLYFKLWPHNICLQYRLFHQVTVDPATWSPTYTRFAALLDNYQPISRMEEESSFSKTTEIDNFLDAIIRTDVCRYLEDFLMRKGTNISWELNVFFKYISLLGIDYFSHFGWLLRLNSFDSLGRPLNHWGKCCCFHI